jgi:hypothetical protein
MPSVFKHILRASGAGLAASVLAAGQLHAQGAAPKPGCWVERTETNVFIAQSPEAVQALENPKLPSLDELMQQTLSRMTPEARAHIDQVELRKSLQATLDASRKALEQARAAASKPVTSRRIGNAVRCSANPLTTLRIAAGDAQLSDSEHFRATQRQTQGGSSVTVTTVGKWVSEASPHLPYSPAPTDLDGHQAKGPHDVTWLDENRIVAVIDGRQITALNAYLLLNLLPTGVLDAGVYKRGLSSVLQHSYMGWAVAEELDRTRSPAQKAKGVLGLLPGVFSAFNVGADDGASVDQRIYDYHYVGNDRQEYAREQRLWGVYMSGATTEADKQKLAQQTLDRYRVSVVDSDFFSGHAGP